MHGNEPCFLGNCFRDAYHASVFTQSPCYFPCIEYYAFIVLKGAEVSVLNILCSYILEGFFNVYLPKPAACL